MKMAISKPRTLPHLNLGLPEQMSVVQSTVTLCWGTMQGKCMDQGSLWSFLMLEVGRPPPGTITELPRCGVCPFSPLLPFLSQMSSKIATGSEGTAVAQREYRSLSRRSGIWTQPWGPGNDGLEDLR